MNVDIPACESSEGARPAGDPVAGELPAPIAAAETFVDVLRYRAANQPRHPNLTFIPPDGGPSRTLTYAELDGAARRMAALLQGAGAQGEPVLLLLPQSYHYLVSFLGCAYAGAVAVPAFPPDSARNAERIQGIVADSGAKLVLTTAEIMKRRAELTARAPALATASWIAADRLAAASESEWQPLHLSARTLLFLQYTSGSTAEPKGVMVSHGNLLHNLKLLYRAFELTPSDRGFTWLPAFHDMGLIGGILLPILGGGRQYIATAEWFVRRPERWLESISAVRATISAAPNFGYELCLQRAHRVNPDVDLSCWRVACTGAEPVREATLERFAEAYASHGFRREAFMPAYGLAEATLMVANRRSGPYVLHADAREYERRKVVPAIVGRPAIQLVSVGAPCPGQSVSIVDPAKLRRCAEGELGEVWVEGASVAGGYWRQPTLSREIFQARIRDVGGESAGEFLRTGDIGFVRDGQLFICGRIKEIVILNGRNVFPQDVERTLTGLDPRLVEGGCAAFAVDAGEREQLVVVHEVMPRSADLDALAERIRATLAEYLDGERVTVALVRHRSLPRTSSGKLKRLEARRLYLSRTLKPRNTLAVHSEAS